uniref:(northern house mosquito) hypothetical protein n=1 Tax=Culex pipiens TaxID=7175 RepID=A0A8D8HUT3_CULPI
MRLAGARFARVGHQKGRPPGRRQHLVAGAEQQPRVQRKLEAAVELAVAVLQVVVRRDRVVYQRETAILQLVAGEIVPDERLVRFRGHFSQLTVTFSQGFWKLN